LPTGLLKNAREWARRHLRWLVTLIAVAVLGGGVCYWHVSARRNADVKRRLAVAEKTIAEYVAAMRAVGEPTEPRDLVLPTVADTDNAAVILQQVFDILEARRPYNANLLSFPPVDPDLSAKLLAALESYEPDPCDPTTDWWDPHYYDTDEAEQGKAAFIESLPQYDEVVRLVVLALERPRCVFTPVVEKSGFSFPYLAPIRHLARHFAGRSLVAAHAGDTGIASQHIVHVFGLASLLNGDTTLISQLVSIAVYWKGLDALQLMESNAPLSDEARRAVLQRLTEVDASNAMTRALLVERAGILIGIQHILTKGSLADAAAGSATIGRTARERLFLLEGVVRFLQIATHIIDASRMKPTQAVFRLRLLGDQVQSMREPQFIAFVGMCESMMSALKRRLDLMARIDAARIGLACEMYRTKTGAYPKSLDELTPEHLDMIPLDPYTGEPFVLEHRPNQLVVRSVGPNGTDDGGEPGRSSRCDDITWRCGPEGAEKKP
jgi:hypothetical protein